MQAPWFPSTLILATFLVHTIALVIAVAPEITEPPLPSAATVEGGTVILTCRVLGAPEPQVKWIRNNTDLTGGRYTIIENGNLEIKDVNFLDAGTYTCFAENQFGKAEASGSLAVKEHTRITDEPHDYEVAAHASATFRCHAVSDSSLPLTIEWLKNGEIIDFEEESRFLKSSDHSLTITDAVELDSGTYTCRARTDLDEASAQATLTVQDVPNAPELIGVRCSEHVANLQWKPMGDNRAPILRYVIQYNTSFTPETWTVAFENVPPTDTTYSIHLSPWANYTFRVIAVNSIGPSLASSHSSPCATERDVPYKNPDNVEGKGTEPTNLVIRWTPMAELEHNAPGFLYRVYWKRAIPGESWNYEDIKDWRTSELVIPDQITFQPYRIKVVATNERGEANVFPRDVGGYSGEGVPTETPGDFKVVQITNSVSALLSWTPVRPASLQGHFKGYKIQTWTEKEGEMGMREIHIKGETTRVLAVDKFIPHSKNFARVLAYNGRYNGPPSEVINFDTPEGVPGTVQFLEAHPLGSSAFYLIWKAPEQPNGVLTGYKIYYQVVKNTMVGPQMEREPHITNPQQTRAKLAGLEAGTKYRLHIAATTRAGEGENFYIERKTRANLAVQPEVPRFEWYREPTDNGYASIRVVWLPNLEGKPGSHFFVKHKQKGETMYEESPRELHDDFIILRGLMAGQTYEFRVVAEDGEYMAESSPQEVDTSKVAIE